MWNLLTNFPGRYGLVYDVYLYSDTHLAALLPPKTATRLLREYPGAFVLRQDAEDGKVLLFEEERLHDLADVLKLRKRRRLSEEQRQLSAERLRQFQFAPARQSTKTA